MISGLLLGAAVALVSALTSHLHPEYLEVAFASICLAVAAGMIAKSL